MADDMDDDDDDDGGTRPAGFRGVTSKFFNTVTFGAFGGSQQETSLLGGRSQTRSFTKSALALELHAQRRRRTHHFDDHKGRAHERIQVPASAYSSLCPLQAVCCGLQLNQLPCGESPLAQSLFGNSVDLATKHNVKSGAADDNKMSIATVLGYKSLEEEGWAASEDPKCLRLAEEERQHLYLCLQVLGITCVQQNEDGIDHFMMSFKKNEIPGSVSDVKNLITKLEKYEHVNVAKFVMACEDPEDVHLIWEACPAAGFLPLKVLTKQELFSSKDAARLVQQLAAALAFLNQRSVNLQHMDISLWNVMSVTFDSLFPFKLFGAGLAGTLHSGRFSRVSDISWLLRSAFSYMPPELCRWKIDLECKQPYSKLEQSTRPAVDVWSAGAVVYTALVGHPPSGGSDEAAIMRRAIETSPSFEAGFSHVEGAGIELLERMMIKNPKKRPRAEALISDPWVVMHARQAEDRKNVHKVVEQLREFSQMQPVMRTIGQVLLKSLRPEKLRTLEDAFHTLDIKGDGELEASELSTFLVDRKEDIRQIFAVLDTNNSAGVSIDEFVLANVFSQEILTERMLLRTFDALDADGTGEITAVELFSVLRQYQKDLTPDAVAAFMGDADRDWDQDIDFEEFRGFFPNVKCRSQELGERVKKTSHLLVICQNAFNKYYDDCKHWKGLCAEELDRVVAARDTIFKEDKCSKETSNDCVSILRKVTYLVKNPPPLQLDPEVLETLKNLGDGSKHKKHVDHAEVAEDTPGGALALPRFFRCGKAQWLKELNPMQSMLRQLQTEPSKQRRRQDAITILDDSEIFLKAIVRDFDAYFSEQEVILQAALPEDALPKMPFARRGVVAVVSDDGDASALINRFKRERAKTVEREKAELAEKEEREKSYIRTDSAGERRGLAWLAKRTEKRVNKPTRATEKADPGTKLRAVFNTIVGNFKLSRCTMTG